MRIVEFGRYRYVLVVQALPLASLVAANEQNGVALGVECEEHLYLVGSCLKIVLNTFMNVIRTIMW